MWRWWLVILLLTLSACRSSPPRWKQVGEGIPPQAGMTSVAVAPGNPYVVYAAAYALGGLYRSEDAGDSWALKASGLEDVTVYSIAVHPQDWERVAVGATDGAYLTRDGGGSWVKLRGLPDTFAYAAAFAPDGEKLYIGTEGAGVYACNPDEALCQEDGLAGKTVLSLAVTPDGVALAGTGGEGVWVKGGDWHPARAPFDRGFVTQMAVAEDGSVYALKDYRAYASQDGGTTWRRVSPEGGRFLSLGVNPHRPGEIYLGTGGGEVLFTRDGGRSWQILTGELHRAEITCIAVSADSTLYLGTHWGGLYRLKNGELAVMGVGKPVVTSLARHPHQPHHLYAGTLHGVYESRDGGLRWELITGKVGRIYVYAVALAPRCPLVQEPTDEAWIYVGAHDGIYVSRDGGRSWHWATGDLGAITVFNITPHPRDPCTIYAGNWGNNILLTTDGGQTWAPIHHGLETLSVHSFAIAPWDSQTLFAGTVEAVYKSTDGGNSWRPVQAGMREKLTTFALLARADGTVYAGTTDGVYVSRDKGETWGLSGLERMTVTALAFGPEGSDVIYAGTEHHGLYRSADGGKRWEPWGDEFRHASIYAILIGEEGVWVGGEGGLFWNEN